LDEFDLFNGELLNSDAEEEASTAPVWSGQQRLLTTHARLRLRGTTCSALLFKMQFATLLVLNLTFLF
jgi:hypothetical protein